jgi:hypothetical protein
MESWIFPHAGSVSDAADPTRAPAFTRAFFERLRDIVFPRMTPALDVDGAELRYVAATGLGLWAMRAPHGLVLACECADTPALLAERARRRLSCLRTRTTPGVQQRTWGLPVYGARLDAASDRLDVVWATPGPWCGFVLADGPLPEPWNLPPHWRQPELASA